MRWSAAFTPLECENESGLGIFNALSLPALKQPERLQKPCPERARSRTWRNRQVDCNNRPAHALIRRMNIHHLELFYYVARHRGITEAVRNIPYGIQQPAVSGQIAQLEEFLGATLFHRRPFVLTPPGQRLYGFIEPFFSGIDSLAVELQGGNAHRLRVGSSDIVLRDHLPELLRAVRRQLPHLKLALREGYQPELLALLQEQEIDLAVTLLEAKTPAGIQSRALLELPLILLVHRDCPLSDSAALWKMDKITAPLICLPPREAVCRNFQQGLARLGVDWFPGIEVSSLDLIEAYVQSGFGIGLTVSIPKAKMSPKIRALPLPGFAPVRMGVLWRGKPSRALQALLDELQVPRRAIAGGAGVIRPGRGSGKGVASSKAQGLSFCN